MILDKYVERWTELFTYNAIEADARKFSAYFLLGSLFAVAAAMIITLGDPLMGAALGLAIAALAHLVLYAFLVLRASGRASKVEEVLPDFLSLVSSNIRSGLTPDKAIIISARDEFGPLTLAIAKAGKNSITGMPLEQVIMGMNEHIKSNALEKTTRMIVEGLHSGGNMSELLEKTALDLRKFRSVRREVNSIILNYVLFIVAAITMGAPALYAVSGFLVDIMLKIRERIGVSGGGASSMAGSVGIFKGQLLLTSDAVFVFSTASILVTVFFGCMAVGVMYSGKRMDGLKYFPVFALISMGILLGIRAVLGAVLGGIMSGNA